MRRWGMIIAASGLVLFSLGLVGPLVPAASANGSMESPISRVAACHAEGPEHPQSAACRQAVAVGGSQAFYDWMAVSLIDAAGQHRQIIPDGRLCSAGLAKYAGLDLPRADWPATSLTAGASYRFRFAATAPHPGRFELYITNDSYDPTQPLEWRDLEPLLSASNPALDNGAYVMDAQLPNKSGRHLIYAIWQRSDTTEAFYSCSDVDFGSASQADRPATADPATPPGAPETPDHADDSHPEEGSGSQAANESSHRERQETVDSNPSSNRSDETQMGSRRSSESKKSKLPRIGEYLQAQRVLAVTIFLTGAIGALISWRHRSAGQTTEEPDPASSGVSDDR